MSDPITLRRAGSEDEPFLRLVFATTRQDEMKLTGWNDAQAASFLRMQSDLQLRYYREQYPDGGYEVIESEGKPIGRIFVSRRAHEIRVVDIALIPEYRNRGIGGRLMREVLDEGTKTGLPVHIHVDKFNRALRLYERLGFRVIGDSGVYLEMEWSTGCEPPRPAGLVEARS